MPIIYMMTASQKSCQTTPVVNERIKDVRILEDSQTLYDFYAAISEHILHVLVRDLQKCYDWHYKGLRIVDISGTLQMFYFDPVQRWRFCQRVSETCGEIWDEQTGLRNKIKTCPRRIGSST